MFSPRYRYLEWVISAFALLIFMVGVAYGADIPKLTNYVNDYANVLNSSDRSALEKRLVNFNKSQPGNPQIVVLIVPTLNGQNIDSYTNDVFHNNKIGQKDNNNGILTVLAMKEHMVRIEPGYDLEPTITDTKTKDVIEGMKPFLRSNNIYGALNYDVDQLSPLVSKGSAERVAEVGPPPQTNKAKANTSNSGTGSFIMGTLIVLAILLFIAWYFLKDAFSNRPNRPLVDDRDEDPTPPNFTNIRPQYRRPSTYYTPPGPDNPYQYYNPPAPPTPPTNDHSVLKSAAAGGLAGFAASEILNSQKNNDDDDYFRRSNSSPDYSSSNSDSSSSSWGSSSSDSGSNDFSGGGGDSGGAGASSSWDN